MLTKNAEKHPPRGPPQRAPQHNVLHVNRERMDDLRGFVIYVGSRTQPLGQGGEELASISMA